MPQNKNNLDPVLQELISSNNYSVGERLMAGLALGAVIVGGTFAVSRLIPKEGGVPKPNEPHKEYLVKPYDTAWSISERAFPNSDPRAHTDMIVAQAGSTLSPGEKIELPDSSSIGIEVSPSS